MNKVKTEERFENAAAFFAAENFSSNQIPAEKYAGDLPNRNRAVSTKDSFGLWAFAKYLLFYAPGVFLLYGTAIFMSDYFVGGDYNADHFYFSFVFVGFGVFLTMLGVGELKNLKYLQVVAAVLAASFAIGFALQILERSVLPRGYDPRVDYDYRNLIGYLIPFFMLVAASIGILAKRRLDREAAELE